ncbi:hypothetical protein OEV82_12370 [Caldibacillus thermolactis]|jgi:hypothetical protein|uniref:Uncharacterized protein n=1 Tax=Pallidibacillus thermolactis TaxID=251051 RepID=A0ABT2WHR7_9BACI|nr:hypothetical protein [Pallidibacillus thermolactis]MCU9595234.1 hypothetical protein [Pallidibacillus thermolactis]
MTIIVENEKEFVKFLKDGYQTGIFKLKLKELHNSNITKRKMIIYKRGSQKISLYIKNGDGNKREFAIYSPEKDTVYIENGNKFIGLRTKYVEKEQYQTSTRISLKDNQTSSPSSIQNKESMRKDNSQSISPQTVNTIKYQDNSSDKIMKIKNLLQHDLKEAKKVWAILKDGEEIQMNNSIFEESGILYLGSKRKNIELANIQTIKYRGKIYLD